jgi:glycosyltransferase involved in cell wall biosynthesis
MSNKKFSIQITTKNRLDDLKITLKSIEVLLEHKNVECVICDDGSSDDTSNFIKHYYPNINLHSFSSSQGYLVRRNFMLNNSKSDYAISLDDDAYFLSEKVLETIEGYFNENLLCALLAFRIYWNRNQPDIIFDNTTAYVASGFVGCGHVWRLDAWRQLPDYPEWFRFYGEEHFMSYQLFKYGRQIIYTPEILIHHMVDLKARKKHKDFLNRQRYSLAAGWFTMFLCYPKRQIYRYFVYSLWSQIKRKTLKGNWVATLAIILALFDLFLNSFKFFTNRFRLNLTQFKQYNEIKSSVIYWEPN